MFAILFQPTRRVKQRGDALLDVLVQIFGKYVDGTPLERCGTDEILGPEDARLLSLFVFSSDGSYSELHAHLVSLFRPASVEVKDTDVIVIPFLLSRFHRVIAGIPAPQSFYLLMKLGRLR